MKNIVVLDAATMRMKLSPPSFPHRWTEYPQTTANNIDRRLATAHIAVLNKVKITEKTVRKAKNLELIASIATGADNINLSACAARGIAVCNVRNYANRGVAEHVVALILSITRGVVHHHQQVYRGRWTGVFSPDMGKLFEIDKLKLGLIGGGALGMATARLAEKMGLTVFFLKRGAAQKESPGIRRLPLKRLLATCDIISLHCPLTAKNKNFIGKKEFAAMKKGAILINTARGGLVESAALIESLKSGHLFGAGLDVLEVEPPPPDHPLLRFRHPRLIITPHVAWAGEFSLQNCRQQVRDNLEKFYAGKPQNILVDGAPRPAKNKPSFPGGRRKTANKS